MAELAKKKCFPQQCKRTSEGRPMLQGNICAQIVEQTRHSKLEVQQQAVSDSPETLVKQMQTDPGTNKLTDSGQTAADRD